MILSIIIFILLIYLGIVFIGLFLGLAGAILSIGFYLFVRLPFAVFMIGIGLVLCCTIFAIPLGLLCFKLAGSAASPC